MRSKEYPGYKASEEEIELVVKEVSNCLDYFEDNFLDGVIDRKRGFGDFGGHLDIASQIVPDLVESLIKLSQVCGYGLTFNFGDGEDSGYKPSGEEIESILKQVASYLDYFEDNFDDGVKVKDQGVSGFGGRLYVAAQVVPDLVESLIKLRQVCGYGLVFNISDRENGGFLDVSK